MLFLSYCYGKIFRKIVAILNIRTIWIVATLFALALPVYAAPFAEWIEYNIPGGETVQIWGEGDEYSAVFEAVDGHTIIWNKLHSRYEYARINANNELVESGIFLGDEIGNEAVIASIPFHLRDTSDAAATAKQKRIMEREATTHLTERWNKLKADNALRAEYQKKLAAGEDLPLNAPPSSPTLGNIVGLTLLIDFPITNALGVVTNTLRQTKHPTVTKDILNELINGEDFAQYGNVSSVRKYYEDTSDGKLSYTNIVLGWFTAKYPREYYDDPNVENGPSARELIGEILAQIRDSPNYTSVYEPLLKTVTYKSNSFLALNVFFAGPTAANWSKGLWAHQWSLDTAASTNLSVQIGSSKKTFSDYQITPVTTSPKIRTFCHENGHMICNFPDLYVYSGTGYGVGSFCTMCYGNDSNPVYFCSYLRAAAGWVTPKELPVKAGYVIVENCLNDVWKYTNPDDPTEYFLIDNRQAIGRDASIPATGIEIWRCRESGSNTYPDKQTAIKDGSETNRLSNELSLVQADGLFQIEREVSFGDSKDTWYADNTAEAFSNVFYDASVPSAKWFNGSDSGLNLHDFSSKSYSMSFYKEKSDIVAEMLELSESLDCENISFTTDVANGWFGQSKESHDTVDAACSGKIDHKEVCTLSATVNGAGTVSFWWKVSSENVKYDFLAFSIDGVQQDKIGGTGSSWEQKSYSITETNNHTLVWSYEKDASVSSGSDCGWVDQVVWSPASADELKKPVFTTELNEVTDSSATFSINLTSLGSSASSASVSVETSESVLFENLTATSAGVATGTPSTITKTINGLLPNKQYYSRAKVTSSNGSFAIGRTVSYTTLESSNANLPVITAESGNVLETLFAIRVTLPDIGLGSTETKIYAEIFSDSLLSNLTSKRLLDTTNIPFTDVREYIIDGISVGTRYYVSVYAETSFGNRNVARPFTVCSRDQVIIPGFADAVDAPNMNFYSYDDEVSWTIDTTSAKIGSTSGRSATIPNNATTVARANVEGPGTLSFWWKVSSESVNYDWLAFSYTGCTTTNKIGGYSGAATTWAQMTYEIPAGITILEWIYRKDGSTSNGLDAGWIDGVVFLPDTSDPEIRVFNAVTSYTSISASFQALSFGTNALSATLSAEYDTDPTFTNPVSVPLGTLTSKSAVVKTISDLQPETQYYLRARMSTDSYNIVSSNYVSFKTLTIGEPSGVRMSIATVGESTADIKYFVDDLGSGANSAEVFIDYSTLSDFSDASSITIGTINDVAAGTAQLTGLASAETFFVRIRITNNAGKTATSSTMSFTTINPNAPLFSILVSGATPTRGTVTISVSSKGSGATSVTPEIEFSKYEDFSSSSKKSFPASTGSTISCELTRLSHNTVYYIRVKLTNNNNYYTIVSGGSFKTEQVSVYIPGLLQGKYYCSANNYPDFNVSMETNQYAEVTLGPYMADLKANDSSITWTNELSGNTWSWNNNTTYCWEGEMWFDAGVTYNFFHRVDDGAAIEIDGSMLTKMSAANKSGYNELRQASTNMTESGWYHIKIWAYDWASGKGPAYNNGWCVGFADTGIGWNTNGCTTVNAANSNSWAHFYDPGDGSLFRVKGADLPSFVTLNNDLVISGTTLTGTVDTEAIEDGCRVTLYAGHTNVGSNSLGWAKSYDLGIVLTEQITTVINWENFCEQGDTENWYVIAHIVNQDNTYEGWSEVRIPSVSSENGPVISYYLAHDITRTNSLLTVSLTSLGIESDSASVFVRYGVSASLLDAVETPTQIYTNVPASATFILSGLSAGTTYYYQVVAEGSNGINTRSPKATFLSGPSAIKIGTASAVVMTNGTDAAMSVSITELQVPSATLSLSLNGNILKTWQGIASPGLFCWTNTVAIGSTNLYIFTATADGETVFASGSFIAMRLAGWFDVRFSDAGYRVGTAWTNISDVSLPGGVWSKESGDESILIDDSSLKYVLLDTRGHNLFYTPTEVSAAGHDAFVDLRVRLKAVNILPDLSTNATVQSALILKNTDNGSVFCGYTANGWIELANDEIAATDSEWADVRAEFDYTSENAPRVRYSVGGLLLKSAGTDWFTIANSQRFVSNDTMSIRRVGFNGTGSLGDFSGHYMDNSTGLVEVGTLVVPVIGSGTTGVSPILISGSTFSVTIDNAVVGAYYTAFACTNLAEGIWTATADSVRTTSSGTLTLDVQTGSDPAKFVKIVVSWPNSFHVGDLCPVD